MLIAADRATARPHLRSLGFPRSAYKLSLPRHVPPFRRPWVICMIGTVRAFARLDLRGERPLKCRQITLEGTV